MLKDIDKIETQEWQESLSNVIETSGVERAQFLLKYIAQQANLPLSDNAQTAYINTIAPEAQIDYPGDLDLERRISAINRWNAMAMVLKAGKISSELGGHIASYASSALLYEIGFNHFFKADQTGGDLIFYQGHSSPGIYARAFLEARLSEDQLKRFRQEIGAPGLSSYPHPWLMPDFWQFPTVSMGLGALQAIYQARFLKYLDHRGLADTKSRKVWAFLGDGETDEPESLGALLIAARQQLDNLVFVVNCNLQRLDGPVNGNGKVIQDLEGMFRGAGWRVIKVIWDSHWDDLLNKDEQGLLKQKLMTTCDGEYQNYHVKDGNYFRQHFFGQSPELLAMVEHLSDEQLKLLGRGGHDFIKIYNAYHQAVTNQSQPTVILVKSVKGYGMSVAGSEGMNDTHQQKKMTAENLKVFRDRFEIPISDADLPNIPFYRPDNSSAEIRYLLERRKTLGGSLPWRRKVSSKKVKVPALKAFTPLLESTGEREISTTMAFVRLLNILLKDEAINKSIVPIIADEARTFGMEGMFRQYGIYSPFGQRYTPVDRERLMYYHESEEGQVLEEGITEAGAFASWLAAATSYSVNNLPMIPFYIYYSMFGFQRIGDFAWAAGDARAKGFLIGATAGRTTLAGEGLQHQDGHNLLWAAAIPNCVSYDPTYSYEMAIIIQDGLRRMYEQNEDIFYYITAMNENYPHPALPEAKDFDIKSGIVKGMYLLQSTKKNKSTLQVQLLGSGTILREVLAAAHILSEDYGISANVWSVTSFNELRCEGLMIERENLLHPERPPKLSYVSQLLPDTTPVIAATDYVRSYADQIRGFIKASYYVLGTDGFGRSDTREQLRHFFEVDRRYIVITALNALVAEQKIKVDIVTKAIKNYGIDTAQSHPLTR